MCFAPQRRALFRHLNFQKWFDFEMCFAPRRRALFWHGNFQKCSENGMFRLLSTFWFWNVLRVTTACNFQFLIRPGGSAPAALASLLFDPTKPQIIWKTQWVATFLPFCAPASSFFWLFLLTFSSDSFFWLFLPTLSSDSFFWLFHVVGSLTSKLPSVTQ